MKLRNIIAAVISATVASSALADVTEQEAIQAQVAGAMASADYAVKNCPNLRVDRNRLQSVVKRSGKSEAHLRASEDYNEQRDVLLEMQKSPQASLICSLLPMAHGGYAEGIVLSR